MSKRRRTTRRGRPSAARRPAERSPLSLEPATAASPETLGIEPAAAQTDPHPQLEHVHAQALVGLITNGRLDEHLTVLQTAIARRHRERRGALARQAAAQLDVGERVRLGYGVRPMYLQGATGTITAWVAQRAAVQLDEPTGRAIDGTVRCPPALLERLPR